MRRQKGLISIGALLGSSSIAPGIAQKLCEYRLKKSWTGCVGTKLAQKTMPQRLIGRVLHVNVSAHAWATELGFHKKEIIDRLNKATGGNSVDEIVFRVGAVRELGAKAPRPGSGGSGVRHQLSSDEQALCREIEALSKGIKDEALRRLILRTVEKSFPEGP
ncbi:MAG: DUF721 domain-containing protein [Deltaproteobacteria bacterium]